MAGGLKVYTTLNTELYTAINDSIQKRAPESDIETAIYAMEPSTGKVLAVVGGKDYEKALIIEQFLVVDNQDLLLNPFILNCPLKMALLLLLLLLANQLLFIIIIRLIRNQFSKYLCWI